MTIKTTSTARDYHPRQVTARYVRLALDGRWRWCETGTDRRYDLRQGTCDEGDLPPEVAAAARERAEARTWPSYVDWPL